jgi:hypothetical protein
MELTLNIYEGKKVIKTYKAQTIDFSFGVVEDVLDALNFESMKTGSNAEIASMVIKCSKQLKPFLMDIFDGLTADEVRHTHIQDIIKVFKDLYRYATNEISQSVIAGDEKN